MQNKKKDTSELTLWKYHHHSYILETYHRTVFYTLYYFECEKNSIVKKIYRTKKKKLE